MNPSIQQTTNSNTPSVASAATALASNTKRVGWSIQNQDNVNPLYVLLGSGATTSLFHFVLKVCTSAKDGNGGLVSQSEGAVYTGTITVASAGTPSYTALEIAP